MTFHGPEAEIVEAILANYPLTLEEDRKCKRQTRPPTTFVATLIPGLPDDVVRRILAALPRTDWRNLRLVSKAWQKSLEDPFFYESRVNLGVTEEWCYTEAWHPVTKVVSWFAFDQTHCRWLALPAIPKKRGLDPGIFGRAAVTVRGMLYVVGGKAGVSGPTLRDVFIYSPFAHRWTRGKSMLSTRHNPLIFGIYRKIYVLGGFDFLNNVIDTGECYDIDTEEWTYVGNKGSPEVLCPSWYRKGWQLPWSRFSFSEEEHHFSYITRESKQVVAFYVPKKGAWEVSTHRDKAKVLVRYGLGTTVNKHIVLLDWANCRLRYTFYPTRVVAWCDVRGLSDLDWVSILTSNPKATGIGSKLVLVGRSLSILMIETDPLLLKEKDRGLIESVPSEPNAPELEIISCLVSVA